MEQKKTKNQRISELENKVTFLERENMRLDEFVKNLEKQVASLTGVEDTKKVMPSTNDEVAEVIEFEGRKCRRVNREARPGDVVVFPKVPRYWNKGIRPNTPYRTRYSVITNNLKFRDNVGNIFVVYGDEQGYDDVNSVLVYEPIHEEKTPNQQRKEIIEKAKEFVRKNSNRRLKFEVNRRNITAVQFDSNGLIKKFAHARCHPNDVFNEDIGKAIAVGRLRKLNVSEFENAVQPTDVVVGQITTTSYGAYKGVPRQVTAIDGEKIWRSDLNGRNIKCETVRVLTIIDDTNAIYK